MNYSSDSAILKWSNANSVGGSWSNRLDSIETIGSDCTSVFDYDEAYCSTDTSLTTAETLANVATGVSIFATAVTAVVGIKQACKTSAAAKECFEESGVKTSSDGSTKQTTAAATTSAKASTRALSAAMDSQDPEVIGRAIAQAETDQAALDQTIQGYLDQIGQANEKKQGLIAQQEDLGLKHQELQEKLDGIDPALNEKLGTEEQLYRGNISRLDAQKSSLQASLSTAPEGQKASIQAQIDRVEVQIRAEEDRHRETEEQLNAEAKQAKEALKAQIDTNEEEAKEIEKQIKEIENTIDGIRKDQEKVEKERDNLEEEIVKATRLQAQLEGNQFLRDDSSSLSVSGLSNEDDVLDEILADPDL